MADERATFEELCEMIETGMDHDQACLWAAQHGLCVTEDQRDHLERDLEVFDTSMLPDLGDDAVRNGEGANSADANGATTVGDDPVASPSPERNVAAQKPQEPELKHLSPQERRNFILGVFILIAVGTALVRFITTM